MQPKVAEVAEHCSTLHTGPQWKTGPTCLGMSPEMTVTGPKISPLPIIC